MLAHTIERIEVGRLDLDVRNVRKDHALYGESAGKELRASIEAHGLLQLPIVKSAGSSGRYWVVAGGRRYFALRDLANEDPGLTVNCIVLHPDADPTEVSLAENMQRVELHPADEIEAFGSLVRSGLPIRDVATRFGYKPRTVRQRLRLAGVDKGIRNAYREGKLTLNALKAFSATKDKKRQRAIWQKLIAGVNHDTLFIRSNAVQQQMERGTCSTSNGRVKYIGLNAYQKAGGAVDRNLFSHVNRDELRLADPELVEKLVEAKLEEEADMRGLREDWSWVEIMAKFPSSERSAFVDAKPIRAQPTEEEAAELERLQEEQNKARYYSREWKDAGEAHDAVTAKIRARDVWPPEVRERAGVILTVDFSGTPEEHHVYRPHDAPGGTTQAERTKAERQEKAKATKKAAGGLSQYAFDRLKKLRSDMIRGHLTSHDAQDLLTFSMAMKLFGDPWSSVPCSVQWEHQYLRDQSEFTPWEARKADVNLSWLENRSPKAKWKAFRELPLVDRYELFTVCVAGLLFPQLATEKSRSFMIEDVARGSDIPWATVRPTAELYWLKMSKDYAVKVAKTALDGDLAPSALALKKKDLAAHLEELFTDPEDPRTAQWAIPGFEAVAK